VKVPAERRIVAHVVHHQPRNLVPALLMRGRHGLDATQLDEVEHRWQQPLRLTPRRQLPKLLGLPDKALAEFLELVVVQALLTKVVVGLEQSLLGEVLVAGSQADQDFGLAARVGIQQVQRDAFAQVEDAALAAAKEMFRFGFHRRCAPQVCVATCVATDGLAFVRASQAQ